MTFPTNAEEVLIPIILLDDDEYYVFGILKFRVYILWENNPTIDPAATSTVIEIVEDGMFHFF